MSDPMRDALVRLSRVRGVRGAMVVDPEAGVPVLDELAEGVDGKAVAALGSALFRRSGQAVRSAGYGGLDAAQMEAEHGHVLAVGTDVLVVVVLAERDAQLGLVRVEAQRALEAMQ